VAWQLEVRVYPDARAACEAQAVCSLQGRDTPEGKIKAEKN